jgi:hypothetical protein
MLWVEPWQPGPSDRYPLMIYFKPATNCPYKGVYELRSLDFCGFGRASYQRGGAGFDLKQSGSGPKSNFGWSHREAVASSYPGRCAKGLRTRWDVTVHK